MERFLRIIINVITGAIAVALVVGFCLTIYAKLFITDPRGFYRSVCYNGNEWQISLGNQNEHFILEKSEWGPPYFRVRLKIMAWPTGAFLSTSNSAQVCNLDDMDKLYNHKEAWIRDHDAEWQAYIKQYPKEGETWYGTGDK